MLFERMMRAVRLDSSLYEEVESDSSATSQAAMVVGIVAVCQAIGAVIGVALGRDGGANPIGAVIGAIVAAFIGWVVWSYITYWIGTSVFHGTATPGEMLRTLGFAQTPGVLGILGFIPFLGGIIGFIGSILTLIAGIVAIRQALDFTTGKAVMTAIVGWIALLVISLIFAAILGVGGLLTGAIR